MSLRYWPSTVIRDLRGAWTRTDQLESRANRAFIARNVRFEPGIVRTRDGLTVAATVAGKVTAMYNWIYSSLNRLIYLQSGTTVKMRDMIGGGTDATLYSVTARGLTVSELGDKAFIAAYDTSGLGAGQCRITLPLVGSGEIDKAFSPPWANTPTVSDVGAGNTTEGVHKFGYIIETRTGFTGKQAPAPSDVFTPVSFTVAAGGRRIQLTMTVNIPADAAYLHPIMTRSDNHEKYFFVPNASITAPAGAIGYGLTWYCDIADEDLAEVESADLHAFCLTQSVAGTGPFNPNAVIPYGKRQVYLNLNVAYASEIDNNQFISEDQHALRLPGERRIVIGKQLRNSLYLIGPSWTYEFSDNGDVPATWAAPNEVSGAIGTIAVQGVEGRTSGDFFWVAAESGLYMFNGRYSERPISYMNSDMWNRINWAAAYAVIVKDDVTKQIVRVAVPLDAATEPNYILSWSYARGLTPETVDFSYDNYLFESFSSIGHVLNPTTARTEFWIGPAGAGSILKESVGTWNDNGNAIVSEYEPGFPPLKNRKIMRFGGADYNVTGAGTFSSTVYGLDRTEYVGGGVITLSTAPGESPQEKFDLISEACSFRMGTAAVDHHFSLSDITVYAKPFATNK